MNKNGTVLFVLMSREGKILMQHRTKDAPSWPNQWGFFGGAIEDGETPEAAIVRETEEELGIHLEHPIFLGSIDNPENNTKEFIFKAVLDIDEATLRAQQKEGDDLKFFSIDELKQLPVMTEARSKLLPLLAG